MDKGINELPSIRFNRLTYFLTEGLQMRGYVDFIKRICLIISFCILLLSVSVGFFIREVHTSFFAWLSFSSMFALITGYVAAWIINISFVRKLKDYFTEWKEEITHFFFGRFHFLKIPIITSDDLPSYIQKDPTIEIIEIVRDTVRKYSIYWIYVPTIMLVMLIFFCAFNFN